MEDHDRLIQALGDRYRIEEEIGEGGMATVFLAEDLKHHRKVAVKVLKPDLAAVVGAERFLAEIETTANLTHPHILPLHDSGEAGSFLFYVMPYVEGETLRDRLDREGQLPVEEAVKLASDLAEALDYAHRHGVVHRDIKPANILMHEGRPLIADFGIALAVGSAGGTRLTETGLSVGTPFYMSPEQATGDQMVGPASDIYALGCVLYEMLVGEPPYVGITAQAVLGKIISGGPVFARDHRSSIPPNVDAAIRRALERLPADRFPSAQGLTDALADGSFRHGERGPADAGFWKPLALSTAVVALVLALVVGWALTRPSPPMPTTRVAIHFPVEEALLDIFDLSPDGSFMIYEGPGETDRERGLWLRQWDALEATRIGTRENRRALAISPDGLEVAVREVDVIRILPLAGGVPRSVAEGQSPGNVVAWSPDGRWLFFERGQTGTLMRVPSAGGPAEEVARFDWEEFSITGNSWLEIMPDGRHAAVEVHLRGGGSNLYSLDLETGETEFLVEGAFPRFANGHLVFASEDGRTVLAAPFDPQGMKLLGAPVPVAEGVRPPLTSGPEGYHFFSVSETGILLYSHGDVPPDVVDLVWVSREGEVTPIDPDWTFDPGDNNRGLSLSPDGTRVALHIMDGTNPDIWIKELPQGPQTRITFDPDWDIRPRWAPDGGSITYLSRQGAGDQRTNVRSLRPSGTGEPELLMDHDSFPIYEAVYSPDRTWLLARTGGTATNAGGRDVWAMQVGSDSIQALLVTEADEKAISFDPEGRFLLYESDETGRNEIYVRPFPNVDDDKIVVSTDGGVMPQWARGGGEIFYVDARNRMMAASVETDPAFRVTGRAVLFDLPEEILFRQAEHYTLYDVTPDGDRFIMFRVLREAEVQADLVMVQNWLGDLQGG